jgi:ribosomal protein L19E
MKPGKVGGKGKKIGRAGRSPKNARYINTNRRFHNKLRRVRRSCGEAFAEAWEKKYRRVL